MRVRVLGTAAGGGYPQWNCACAECARARADGVARGQDCLAVSGDGRRWHLVNASPDIRGQILATPELTPGPGRRDTPISGVLLSTAELDHTLGLLALREGSTLNVYAPVPVQAALTEAFPVRRVLAGYGSPRWQTIDPGTPLTLDERLEVTAIRLSAKRPRYASAVAAPRDPNGAHGAVDAWVVAYRFHDLVTGGVLVYAPCLAEWTERFDAALASADYALLDGTCFSDDEMNSRTGGGRGSRQMGHLPIADSLLRLSQRRGPRVLFTHLNNTNPVLNPDSAEYAAVLAAGADIAADGQLLEL